MQTRSLKIEYTNGQETIHQVRTFARDTVAERLLSWAERLHGGHITYAVGDGELKVEYNEVPSGSYTLTALLERKAMVDDGRDGDVVVDDAQTAGRAGQGVLRPETLATSPVQETQGAMATQIPKQSSTTSQVKETQDGSAAEHGALREEILVGDDGVLAQANDRPQETAFAIGQSSSKDDLVLGAEPKAVLPQPPTDTSIIANEGRAKSRTPTSSTVAIIDQPGGLDSNVQSNNQLGTDDPTVRQRSKIIAPPCIDPTQGPAEQTNTQTKRKRQSNDTDHTPTKKLIVRLPYLSVVTKGQESEARSSRYGRKHPPLAPHPHSTGLQQPIVTTTASSDTQSSSENVAMCVVYAGDDQDLSISRRELGVTPANFDILKRLIIRHLTRQGFWWKDPAMLDAREKREWEDKFESVMDSVVERLEQFLEKLNEEDIAPLHDLGRKLSERMIIGVETSEQENDEELNSEVNTSEEEYDDDDDDSDSRSLGWEWQEPGISEEESNEEESVGEESVSTPSRRSCRLAEGRTIQYNIDLKYRELLNQKRTESGNRKAHG